MDEQKAKELARQCGAEITDYIDHAASEPMIVFFDVADLMKFAKKIEEDAEYYKATMEAVKAEFESHCAKLPDN